jgi:hypothetical protein
LASAPSAYEALGFVAIVLGVCFSIASGAAGTLGTVSGVLMFLGFGVFLAGRFM